MRERRTRHRLWAGAILALAFLIRLLPAPFVVMSDRIAFFGHDAWYHMRRIVYTLANFPSTLDFDPYINFPNGARAIWTPVFDWSIAALIVPFSSSLSPWSVGLLASLVPPLLGALSVLTLYRLALRHFDERVALLGAGVSSVLPGHFWYSQIGFVDHHCAVALVATGMLGVAMAFVDALARGRASWGGAAGLGALLGGALALWPGMLLHVGIVETGLLVLLLTRPDRDAAVSVATRLAGVQLAAVAVVAPFSLGNSWGQWSALSPVVLSSFQPWFFASAGLFGAACAGLWRFLPRSGGSAVIRVGSALGVGLVILLAGGLAFPTLVAGAAEAWKWISMTDDFQGLVAESQPLFMMRSEVSLVPAAANLSIFFFAIPLALLLGLVAARRSERPSAYFLLLGWTFTVCLAATLQRRFTNSASIVVALLMAVSLVAAYDRLKGWASASTWRRRTLLSVFVAAGAGLLLPAWMIYAPFFQPYVDEGGAVVLRGDHYNRYAMMETADWMRQHTSSTGGWLDASVQPQYSILAPWVMGHVIEYVARRPTMTNNFGDDIGSENFLAAQEYFGTNEARAVEILDAHGVRYVVVPHRQGFLAERPLPTSMYYALFAHDGSEFVPKDVLPKARVAALERHRLIYEFSRTNRDKGRRPTYKVFEYVRGARLRGRTKPGAEIRIELDLETREGRHFAYEARTRARENGRFQLRVPYVAGVLDADVTSGDHYRIKCSAQPDPDATSEGSVYVNEADVLRGRVIDISDPCSSTE